MFIEREIDVVEFVHNSKWLRLFGQSLATWELLFLISALDGNPDYGIGDYIDMLKSSSSSRLTLSNFIRDRINDGSFLIIPSKKKSRKTLVPSHKLQAELDSYLAMRLTAAVIDNQNSDLCNPIQELLEPRQNDVQIASHTGTDRSDKRENGRIGQDAGLARRLSGQAARLRDNVQRRS